MRKLILHYHLFKNAGTSVDEVLKANFGNKWVTREFPSGNPEINGPQVSKWIDSHPNAIAFSSHTALLPVPSNQDSEVFPIIFVRHPLDRIASAYVFEQKQGGDSFGATLASHTSMKGYIAVRLSMNNDRQCRNFHAGRLAHMFHGNVGLERDKALQALDELPFIGLVESFDDSMKRLQEWLRPHFPNFQIANVAKNVNRGLTTKLDEKLDRIRVEIGDDLYNRVLEANAIDLEIFSAVKQRYAQEQI